MSSHNLEGPTPIDSPTGLHSSADGEKHGNLPKTSAETPLAEEAALDAKKPSKGVSFWMIMLSLAISTFLSALDLTAITTALPTIAADLNGQEFTWIASAYALSSTAFLPVFGSLAEAFGRKAVLLMSITFFAIGSAIGGSAPNLDAMIAGRTVQGIGGGGILACTEFVVADLVPLAERGTYFGLIGLVWAIASAIGPTIGGALSEANWRWLFYLNLPICAIAFALVTFFMTLRVPAGSLSSKLGKVDWPGALIFVIFATSAILGLTWGGDAYPWKSAAVLVPLLVGLAGLAVFVVLEKKWIKNPMLPWDLISNRTSLMGYIVTFLHGLVSVAVIYYMPVWFQAVKSRSPIRAGVDLFPTAWLIAPMAIVTGVSVTILQRYKWQGTLGWVFTMAGAGLLASLKSDSSMMAAHGTQTLIAIGLGINYAASTFAVIAPLPTSLNAPAMSLHAFSRSFGQVLGITIGSTVLLNQLSQKLPAEFTSTLPHGASGAFTQIPVLKELPAEIGNPVRAAFSDSIQVIWYVMIGIAALGLLASLFVKNLPLDKPVDEKWALEEKMQKKQNAAEVAV